jgi:hypothetical protein
MSPRRRWDSPNRQGSRFHDDRRVVAGARPTLRKGRGSCNEPERSGGLTVRCFRRPVRCAATSSCGRTGCPGRVRPAGGCPATGAITAAWAEPLRPFCRSLDGHVRCAGRCAGGHRPVRRPRCGQRVSDTPAASPVGRPNPCRTTAICNGCAGADASPWCPAAGRVDRWADTPTRTVPARQTCGAVSVRPAWPPHRWGRTAAEPAADTSDRSAAAVRGCCPRFRTPRTARRSPSWPASGRDRYRNRSPGRRPLVGCSQRW